MYKTRIKQWGLDKKHKENEMRAIVRKTKTLRSQGKSATFRVRGRPVDYKDVVSYFKRKNVRLEDIITQRSGSNTPEAVDYFITVPSPITTPESMASPELILVSIRDYFRGSFDNGTWVTTDPQIGCQTTRGKGDSRAVLDQPDSDFLTACELFHEKRFQEAGQSFIAATSRAKVVLLTEHPDTLQHIFQFTQRFLMVERYEVALAVLRQYSALAEIIMGKTHPIGCICGRLASIAPSQWGTVIARCTGSLADHFESLAGPLNMSTISSRLVHITSEVDTEHNVNQRLILMNDLLHSCETILGPQDGRTGEVRSGLASYYYSLSDFPEAMRVARDLMRYAQHVVGSENIVLYIEGLQVLARSEYAMGDVYSAEIHLREAIERRTSNYGPNDGRGRTFLVRLAGWLVKQGQFGSAAQVYERWKESLAGCTDYD